VQFVIADTRPINYPILIDRIELAAEDS